VVNAPAAADRIFFEQPPSRGGLARIEDARAGAGDGVGEAAGQGGDAGEAAEKVEGRPFRHQETAGIARDLHHDVALADVVTILD